MVTDKTGSGEDVLFLIGKHNIVELLENPKMKSIIEIYWEGPYNKNSLKLLLSKALKIGKIKSQLKEDQGDALVQPYSYFVWSRSLEIRKLMDGIMIVLAAIGFQILTTIVMEKKIDFNETYNVWKPLYDDNSDEAAEAIAEKAAIDDLEDLTLWAQWLLISTSVMIFGYGLQEF